MSNNFIIYTLFMLGVVLLVGRWLYNSRKNLRSLSLRFLTVIALVIAIPAIYGALRANSTFSGLSDESKGYVMKLNQTKSIDGTRIKLEKVFMDLMQLRAAYSVRGKEKLVAVELKKNPEDVDSLGTITGLWVGKRIIPEQGMFSMPYKEEKVVDPIYIVFYLSNGKSISFEVRDSKDVKSRVKVITVDKTIEYGTSSITFTKLQKGLNYSTLLYESDFMTSNLDITIADGASSNSKNPSWSGGGGKYSGGVSFGPIKSERITVKVKDKSSEKEEVFEVDVK